MKKYQFEEIVWLLSTLIAAYSYVNELYTLSVIFSLKAIFDFYSACKAAIKSIKDTDKNLKR